MRRKSKTLSELRLSLFCLRTAFFLLRTKDVHGKKIEKKRSIIQEKVYRKGKIYLKEYFEKGEKKFCEKQCRLFFLDEI